MTKHITFESFYVAGQGVVTVNVNSKPKYAAVATNDFQGGWFVYNYTKNYLKSKAQCYGRFASMLKIAEWIQEQK